MEFFTPRMATCQLEYGQVPKTKLLVNSWKFKQFLSHQHRCLHSYSQHFHIKLIFIQLCFCKVKDSKREGGIRGRTVSWLTGSCVSISVNDRSTFDNRGTWFKGKSSEIQQFWLQWSVTDHLASFKAKQLQRIIILLRLVDWKSLLKYRRYL